MSQNILVIGGVAAGPKAAARAKRYNPKANVTVVEKGKHLSYAGCGLPFYIGGLMEQEEELMTTPAGAVRNPAFFKNVKDVDMLTETLAEKIDRENKKVRVKDLNTGEAKELPYDKLVLATGSTPAKPRLEGIDLNGVVTLSNVEEATSIKELINQKNVKNVAIIGAGLVGVEMADILGNNKELNVTLLEMMGQVMPALLDKDMALVLEKHMKQQGINLRTSTRVQKIEGSEYVEKVITEKEEIQADLVIVASGVKPNVDLAKDAGLEIGSTGGVKVNEYLQTSDPDIYAGGDCVESIHVLTQDAFYAPMGSVANRQGRVIGDNVCGGKELFPGVLGTAIAKVFNFTIGRTGLTVEEAKKRGLEPESFICVGPDRAHFYPGTNPVMIKLIADKNTRKLLGAQLTGPGNVDKRLDIIAGALNMRATIDQLAVFDLAYAPPYATALDTLTHTANSLRNKLDGLAKSLNPLEVKRKMDEGEQFVLLDVRSPKEYEEVRLPYENVMHIPLAKLREKAGEIPRDTEVILFCKVSMRGYDAQRILEGLDFDNISFMEGGIATWAFEVDNTPLT